MDKSWYWPTRAFNKLQIKDIWPIIHYIINVLCSCQTEYLKIISCRLSSFEACDMEPVGRSNRQKGTLKPACLLLGVASWHPPETLLPDFLEALTVEEQCPTWPKDCRMIVFVVIVFEAPHSCMSTLSAFEEAPISNSTRTRSRKCQWQSCSSKIGHTHMCSMI